METGRQSQHTINPPQYPRKHRHSLSPGRHTHQDSHINQRRQTHRERSQEQTLMRMPKHGWEDLRVHGIPQTRNEREEEEEHQVQHEEDLGNDLEPVSVVGQLVQQDGDHTRAHNNNKPPLSHLQHKKKGHGMGGKRVDHSRGSKIPNNPPEASLLETMFCSNSRRRGVCFHDSAAFWTRLPFLGAAASLLGRYPGCRLSPGREDRVLGVEMLLAVAAVATAGRDFHPGWLDGGFDIFSCFLLVKHRFILYTYIIFTL